MKHLTSRDNDFFRDLRKVSGSARARRKAGQALLDGAHLLQACIEAGIRPLHVVLGSDALQNTEIATLLKKIHGVPLTRLDDPLFAELSDLKSLSGVLTLIAVPSPARSIRQSRFCLLLEEIQDPGNLGSIMRSAAAAGCDAVFLSRGCADPWSPKVLRAGMGGHFALCVHEDVDLATVAAEFRGRVIAAALHGGESVFDCNLRGDIAFAVGNEGAGLSGELMSLARHCVAIPMAGAVESLNAAAATAVCLFEAVRQRRSG